MNPDTAILAIWLATAAAAPGAPSRLVLRDGTVYFLKEPPRISGTRVIFTTLEGRTFSMAQSEIDTVGSVPARKATPRQYDSQDDHALGAIARQQRDARGRRAEVAPRGAARARRVTRPRPKASAPPTKTSPAAGKKSPG